MRTKWPMFETIKLVTIITVISSSAKAQEVCELETKNEHLQVVFVVDISSPSSLKIIQNIFPNVFAKILEMFNTFHPEAQVSITTHDDIPKLKCGKNSGDRTDKCYKRVVTMSQSPQKLIAAVSNLWRFEGPQNQNSTSNILRTIALAVSDKHWNWTRSKEDLEGRRMQRLIVLITDSFATGDLVHTRNMVAWRGNGTDTCEISLPPTPEQVGTLLKETDVKVIGIYTNDKEKDYVDKFNNFFNTYSIIHCPLVLKEYSESKKKETEDEVQNGLKRCTKDVLSCEFHDPLPYNTLGL